MTHICVSKLTTIGSDNALSPGRRQTIIWTNVWIWLIGPLGTNFSEILIEIYTFSFKKMHLKMSSEKRRPSCLGLNVLNISHEICTLLCCAIGSSGFMWYKSLCLSDLLHSMALGNMRPAGSTWRIWMKSIVTKPQWNTNEKCEQCVELFISTMHETCRAMWLNKKIHTEKGYSSWSNRLIFKSR